MACTASALTASRSQFVRGGLQRQVSRRSASRCPGGAFHVEAKKRDKAEDKILEEASKQAARIDKLSNASLNLSAAQVGLSDRAELLLQGAGDGGAGALEADEPEDEEDEEEEVLDKAESEQRAMQALESLQASEREVLERAYGLLAKLGIPKPKEPPPEPTDDTA